MIQNAPGTSKPVPIGRLEAQLAISVKNQLRISPDKTAQILLTAISTNSSRDQSNKKGTRIFKLLDAF
jgi:hypothetical protein